MSVFDILNKIYTLKRVFNNLLEIKYLLSKAATKLNLQKKKCKASHTL